MKHRFFLLVMLFFFVLANFSCNTNRTTFKMDDEYILNLIGQMTLEEKVSMVHGEKCDDPQGIPYVGYLPGIARLGIPQLTVQNGPSGAGASFTINRALKPATAFPVPISQASTWNMDLMYRFGKALGSEVMAQGRTVCAAPMVNIIRIPEGGRNFELFSEDPYLSARCAVPVIKGIQEMGIIANVKAVTANNQETWRFDVDNTMDERSLREIYLPSFEAAVKEADVSSIMTAYPRINGVQCSENPMLLRQIIKNEWGFKGFILTDWGTKHTTVAAANSGLDLEMSGWGKFGEPQFKFHLLDAVKNGEVAESTLDEMIYRILNQMKRFGYLDKKVEFPEGRLDAPEHQKLALEMAIEGCVLLKNENGVLPLNDQEINKLALFGDVDTVMASGGGSSKVVPFYKVSPREGFSRRLGEERIVCYEDYRNAGPADAAIVFFYEYSTEGHDRPTVSLEGEREMIEALSAKYKKLILVLRTGGSYVIPWIDQVDAVLQVWFPGQEEGNAEAALIFGDANPSGKLPVTFGLERSDFPAAKEEEFPGIDKKVNYSEGIFVGYRYFDSRGTNILFPFGYGLSYTEFSYSDISLSRSSLSGRDTLIVSYTVTNTGERAGAEVSQLYIKDLESSVERPEKELKGFDKAFLAPGESKRVAIPVSFRSLAFWDENDDRWKAEKGTFEVLVGASAENIRLTDSFEYKGE